MPPKGMSPLTGPEVLTLLIDFGRRLATLADQAHEAREQAQYVLDRIYLLQEDVAQLRRSLAGEEVDQRASASPWPRPARPGERLSEMVRPG